MSEDLSNMSGNIVNSIYEPSVSSVHTPMILLWVVIEQSKKYTYKQKQYNHKTDDQVKKYLGIFF